MPKSFFKVYLHLIFSTKNRERWLDDKIRHRIHGYIASTARNMECPYVYVGGADDHIHVLLDPGKKNIPVDIIRILKRESSTFAKTLGREYSLFYWQNGYALFSVSPAQKNKVENYIAKQELHHKKMTFKEEFRAYLEKYEIEYDERYIWD